MRRALGLGAAAALALVASPSSAYEIRYRAQILPDRGMAEVAIEVEQEEREVLELSFTPEPGRLFDERADGELIREEDGDRAGGDAPAARLVWSVPAGGGTLRYSVRIDRARDGAEYDARCASRWMVARAEDIFSPMATRFGPGANEADATLDLRLPPRWDVAHPYPEREGLARIEQDHRQLDQPKGWIVAGDIDRVSFEIDGTVIVLAAPDRHDVRLHDIMAFLRWTVPTLVEIFGSLPERMLVASADDPMWRGGLSAPGSVYVHADRPFVTPDASSPLLHELVHMVTRARSAPGADWIVEGIAEHYSREVLRRVGAVSQRQYERTLERLERKARRVRSLEGEAGSDETALAVLLFHDLDRRIREASDGEYELDDVVATLVGNVDPIDREGLEARILTETGFDASDFIASRLPGGARTGRH